MPPAQAAPALARYLKQQAANRHEVQQRGAAPREAEQKARSKAAAEAPRVLNQLEAEARLKIAMAVCPDSGPRLGAQQQRATSGLQDPDAVNSTELRPSSSKRHRSKSAVWPDSSAASSTPGLSSSPMHFSQQALQQQQRQQQQGQSGNAAQAGCVCCQSVAAGVQPCCLQQGPSQAADLMQPRRQAWQQQQQQEHNWDLQHVQQQWHQPRPPCQHQQQPDAWRQQHSHHHQQQQQLLLLLHGQASGFVSSSSSSCSRSSSSGAPLQHSHSRGSCRPASAGSLLQPLLPQQPVDQMHSSDHIQVAAASAPPMEAPAREQPQVSSTMLWRPASPIAQVLCALACHAAAPRAAASADPLMEPLLGQ